MFTVWTLIGTDALPSGLRRECRSHNHPTNILEARVVIGGFGHELDTTWCTE